MVTTIGLLDDMHPVYFGFMRSLLCAVCFSLMLTVNCRPSRWDSVSPGLHELLRHDRSRFLVMAWTLFSGNLCNITGVAVAGAVTASLWQP